MRRTSRWATRWLSTLMIENFLIVLTACRLKLTRFSGHFNVREQGVGNETTTFVCAELVLTRVPTKCRPGRNRDDWPGLVLGSRSHMATGMSALWSNLRRRQQSVLGSYRVAAIAAKRPSSLRKSLSFQVLAPSRPCPNHLKQQLIDSQPVSACATGYTTVGGMPRSQLRHLADYMTARPPCSAPAA